MKVNEHWFFESHSVSVAIGGSRRVVGLWGQRKVVKDNVVKGGQNMEMVERVPWVDYLEVLRHFLW